MEKHIPRNWFWVMLLALCILNIMAISGAYDLINYGFDPENYPQEDNEPTDNTRRNIALLKVCTWFGLCLGCTIVATGIDKLFIDSIVPD